MLRQTQKHILCSLQLNFLLLRLSLPRKPGFIFIKRFTSGVEHVVLRSVVPIFLSERVEEHVRLTVCQNGAIVPKK